VTAFVLKYRLAKTGDDAGQEFKTLWPDKAKFQEMMAQISPLSFSDGLEAVTYVRQHASEWGVSPDRVGIMGFSAGGAVVGSVLFHYTAENRPAFAAPIYGRFQLDTPVPADAPPVFIAAANDDPLGLAPASVALYQKWAAAHKSAELHIYAKGGHGFGMRKENITTDNWPEQFAGWLQLQGFLSK
jgi:acetyl esterase/lipase